MALPKTKTAPCLEFPEPRAGEAWIPEPPAGEAWSRHQRRRSRPADVAGHEEDCSGRATRRSGELRDQRGKRGADLDAPCLRMEHVCRCRVCRHRVVAL